MQVEKQVQEYICPKCRTKIAVTEGERLPSLYCRSCMKNKQLTMLRLVWQRSGHISLQEPEKDEL